MIDSLLKSKYEIKTLLAEDIMSFLYEAKGPDGTVFVWQYKDELLNPGLIRRLMLKAEALLSVRFPRLLPLIDYHYDGKFFYAVYEKTDPQLRSLEESLDAISQLSVSFIWQQCFELASLYRFLHQQGWVLGSINFNGIYVDSKQEFVLAKILFPIEILKEKWKDLEVIEDLMFYAPEFVRDQTLSQQTDTYAFGMLLYILLSKKWPFPFTYHIAIRLGQWGQLPALFEKKPSLPERLPLIIGKCLQQDPDARFKDFSELLQAFHSNSPIYLQHGFSEEVRTSAPPNPIPQKSKIWRILLAVMMGICVCAGGYVYYRYHQYVTSIPELKVPDVIGLSFEQAKEVLAQHNLNAHLAGERLDLSTAPGRVLQSKPSAGSIVKENRWVRLFISKGGGNTKVPRFVGSQKEEALLLLEEKGLSMESITERFSLLPIGIVISQYPSPDAMITPSQSIRLLISKGLPIDMELKKVPGRDNYRSVSLSYETLNNMPTQNIEIYYTLRGKKTLLSSKVLGPNIKEVLRVDLESGGSVDIFYNQELKKQLWIQSDLGDEEAFN